MRFSPGYCWCPIGDGWDVWIMLAVMAVGYAAWARRRECRDNIPTKRTLFWGDWDDIPRKWTLILGGLG